MVRNIAGSLMVVGCGEQSPDWFGKLLATKNRNQAAATAPAAGLYLLRAFYPEPFILPHDGQKPVLF
jgi:tRNA pseudouridine38-40 synthase